MPKITSRHKNKNINNGGISKNFSTKQDIVMSTSRKVQIVVSYKESYCRKNVFFFAIELVEKVMFDK